MLVAPESDYGLNFKVSDGNRIVIRDILDEESSKQDEASNPSLNRGYSDLNVETEACNGNLDINDGSGDVEANVDYSNSTLGYSGDFCKPPWIVQTQRKLGDFTSRPFVMICCKSESYNMRSLYCK